MAPARAHVHYEDDGGEWHHHDDSRDDDYGYRDVRPPVIVTVTRALVDERLASAGLGACLETLPGRTRATVRVRVRTDGRAHARARSAPRDPDLETCLRRTADAALEWNADVVRVSRAFSTRIVLRSPGRAGAAAEDSPRDDAVRALVTSARDTLTACLGVPTDAGLGPLTLVVRVTRGGALVLHHARVGRLVPDEEAAACLRDAMRALVVEAGAERFETTLEIPL